MPLVEFRSVVKDYRGLRPFRLEELIVEAGEVVAIGRPDEAAAGVFTDLLTGTTLPDRGEILIGGRSTASIAKADEWLSFLDRFGLVNPRTVLLDQLTIAQNLAVALTLDLDPMIESARRLVEALADEVGLPRAALDGPLPAGSALTTLRVRLGRALAHGPSILVVEHPSLGLARSEAIEAARLIRQVGERRRLTAFVLAADPEVLRGAASRRLEWRPATGQLIGKPRWRRWRLA